MLPKILIVISDLLLACQARSLLSASLDGATGTESYAENSESAVSILEKCAYLDLCICDQAALEPSSLLLSQLQTRFSRARIIVVARRQDAATCDVALSAGSSLLSLPEENALFRSLGEATLRSIQIGKISHFRVGLRVKVDPWCDWYDAFDTILKREVYLKRIHSWASSDEKLRFQATTKLMVHAQHDHVRTVYVAGEFEGSGYACLERLDFPRLADLLERREPIDTPTGVRILTTLVSVLRFWEDRKFPHSKLNETNVFVSKNHFVKVENCVEPALSFEPLTLDDLRFAGTAISALLSADKTPPLLKMVLDKLQLPSQLCLRTTLGEIVVELYHQSAPITVANFLKYTRRGIFNGTLFHHVIRGFVAQGGYFTKEDFRIPTDTPILNEASTEFLNRRGTLAMARHKDDPNSATSQFVFNLADNAQLDSVLGKPGYTVFGKVIQGMDVVDRIAGVPVRPKGSHLRPINPVILEKVEEETSALELIINEIQALADETKTISIPQEIKQNSKDSRLSRLVQFPSSMNHLSSSLQKISKMLSK